ncbi:chromosome segregation protein SMC [Algiphilus sp.]|uniref:chromosome segregation protein SMC n=2 Tax=Algiphilus sp. TaxID=1872431 RepID=UPI0025C365AF|nr:chromosome segregation protein SMC [Algiphilus sp.]MCK5771644.1 chromosome segregation protein SMC [Algiphilus sp.]
MRLSQIKLAGFKSFVDVTTLPLPSNLTSVVGPNGCGKSNIIDAVRWVLGESSMKQLRSSSSEDVIFNGSRSRKPVGRASVELAFDNSDQTLQGPYAHYTEVAVRRELTRDGQSQYFLNGAKCLRRDIVDLFLGTGLGARSGYAIIEQGMVSRMIEAKPEELRQWLEEAAGISRYRERRRETESRIRSTRENLSRLDDLCGEVQARARALERQAENAKKYKRYREEEARLKVEIHFLNTRDTEAQAEAAAEKVREGEAADLRARNALDTARNNRLRAEADLESARGAFNEAQSAHYAAEAETSRTDQALRHARELAEMRQREIASLDDEQQRAEKRRAEAAEQAEQAGTREQQLQAELDAAAGRHQQAGEALETAEATASRAAEALEKHDADSREPLEQLTGERTRLREREHALNQLDERRKRLHADRERTPAPDPEALAERRRATARAAEALRVAREAAETAETHAEHSEHARNEAQSALAECRAEHTRLSSERTSLQTLQAAALGEDDPALHDWVHAVGLGEARRVGQGIRVAEGWETAAEHVLGRLLQAPLADDLQTALAAVGQAPEAGAAVVRTGGDAVTADAGSLAARVDGPAAVRALLTGIRCADEAATAERLLAELDESASVITPDGVWRARGWLRTPPRGGGEGVIARTRRLEAIESALADEDQRLQRLEHEAEEAARVQSEAVAARRAAAAEAERAREAHVQAQSAEHKAQQEFDNRTAQRQRIDEALAEVERDFEQRTADCAALRETVSTLEARTQTLASEREQLAGAVQKAREERDAARRALAELERSQSDLQARLAAARSEAQSAARQAEESANRARQLAESLAARRDEPARDAAVEQAQEQVRVAQEKQQQTREAFAEARRRMEAGEQALAETRTAEQTAQGEREQVQNALQEARLEHGTLDSRRQTLAARFEEFGVTRAEVAEGLDENADAEQWQERLAQLQRRIERLGAINLAAIDELAETQERAEDLAKQHADITEALETLEEAIRKIDRETKARFRETFDKVNERFSARFPRLFGGGEASLELTDDDLLSAGVRVMARPPGKRNTTIHLLSGGEKAMTAVALLLALFELNPAPFCLLDEVDAPLDDANVTRFCDVIREMSANVQFVIITHNKITMALAEHLHGVTMAEPGSSRLVSVNVQEAASLAGEAA